MRHQYRWQEGRCPTTRELSNHEEKASPCSVATHIGRTRAGNAAKARHDDPQHKQNPYVPPSTTLTARWLHTAEARTQLTSASARFAASAFSSTMPNRSMRFFFLASSSGFSALLTPALPSAACLHAYSSTHYRKISRNREVTKDRHKKKNSA